MRREQAKRSEREKQVSMARPEKNLWPALIRNLFSASLHDAGADAITDCGDGGPGAEEWAVVIHQTAGSGIAKK